MATARRGDYEAFASPLSDRYRCQFFLFLVLESNAAPSAQNRFARDVRVAQALVVESLVAEFLFEVQKDSPLVQH
jgi:hypothetical protein